MKKIIAIILALVMTVGAVFTMASCSKDDKTLVCGVTIFENMNEQNPDGSWTGFESEFAMEVGKLRRYVCRCLRLEQKYCKAVLCIHFVEHGSGRHRAGFGTVQYLVADFGVRGNVASVQGFFCRGRGAAGVCSR